MPESDEPILATRPRFSDGPWPPLLFAIAFAAWLLLSNGLARWLLGAERSYVVEQLLNVPSGLVQVAIAYVFLRHAGVRLRDIGAGARQVVPALAAVLGLLAALNAVVAGLLFAMGEPLAFGWYALYRTPPFELSATAIAVAASAQYVFVGPVEELAFRGYLQNKFASMLGLRRPRVETTLAVVGAALVFALMHVPTLLVLGNGGWGALPLLFASGVLFGVIYALTRNLVMVALLHGVGNLWPLAVDPAALGWPNWGVILVLYALLVVFYRRWA
jgi:membrane protease YdiL (CAAX protease family)